MKVKTEEEVKFNCNLERSLKKKEEEKKRKEKLIEMFHTLSFVPMRAQV